MEKDSTYYLDKFKDVMAPTYGPQIVVDRGEGSRLWDIEGKEYMDLAGGIAVLGVGHCHPKVVETLKEQAGKLWHVSNIFANKPAIDFADKLTDATFAEQIFLSNSGAEANEAALKLARRYAVDNFNEEKCEIITFHNSFHGRTLFTVTVGGQEKYRSGFGPTPGGITYAEFNNLEDVKQKISEKTCAVIMEPIQGEGGVINATDEFAQGVRELCDQHQALLIFDEVQTGFGRTGSLYAYQQMGVTPDILTSAKALGAGFPIGAMLTTKKIAASFVVGTHGSTYGGNPLGTAVAGTVLDLINTPEVLEGVQKRRMIIEEFFAELNQEEEVFGALRGKGLLTGIPLLGAWKGKAREFLVAGLKEGVMILVAGPDVIRMAPSLIIPEEDLKEALKRFKRAIKKVLA
ncbi:MAG: aspartate aminotransferase family protein [SAR324 cluster bacterium]|uniref:Acetylornithine aminotransferase n=1 Tax=SAR324 cluster bacterium TaxID=2024889 RepID=A0A2A4T1F8_9DELT|nr:MAG: aspartate aminotransferase family protein [SAR324 cluster bacterium]